LSLIWARLLSFISAMVEFDLGEAAFLFVRLGVRVGGATTGFRNHPRNKRNRNLV
jgi:hypothetical protein